MEDLLQKHTLVEADVSAQAEGIRAVQAAANRFTSDEMSECSHPHGDTGCCSARAQNKHARVSSCDRSDSELLSSLHLRNFHFLLLFSFSAYKPCEPALVEEKAALLGQAYEELGKLAAERRAQLEDSRRLWQLLWELGEEAAWMREQEQIMATEECGKDLSSALRLLSKHEAFRDEMAARYGPLGNSIASGEQLVKEGHCGAPEITERIKEIKAQWDRLEEVRKKGERRWVERWRVRHDGWMDG